MAVRRQAYEWRNVIPTYSDNQSRYNRDPYVIGHPVLDCNPYVAPESNPTSTSTPPTANYAASLNNNIASPLIPGNLPIGLFTGGYGNNTKTSAHVLANQMVIIDSLACWPPDANLNIFIDNNYYYDAPDFSAINGLSGYTVPFPEPNYANIFTVLLSKAMWLVIPYPLGKERPKVPTPVYGILPALQQIIKAI